MNEQQVKLATCKITCADELGTGWLISADKVLTAYHCVAPAIDSDNPISVEFGEGHEEAIFASVVAYDAGLDACILLLPSKCSTTPIALSTRLPREGAEWSAFGHPVVKFEIGHRLEGRVSQILDQPKMSMDLDLSVKQDTALTDYRGLSGAALICGPLCYGMLRIAVDHSLGAISVAQLGQFLIKNQIDLEQPEEQATASVGYAERPEFSERFEAAVNRKSSGFLFLEGAPGIGKTTFCETFQPELNRLELAGTYSFASGDRGTNATLRIQPEIFHDWLNTLVSLQSTGKPARLSEMHYSALVTNTSSLFSILSERYASREKVGVLFVDGLNEAAAVGAEAFTNFIGLFPEKLQEGLVIIFSGPSYAHVAAPLGKRLQLDDSIQMPALERDVATEFCKQGLAVGRTSPSLVARICDRAQGHPLYLHYLIDYVNGGATDEELDELPTFSGSIRAYYDVLWAQLLSDAEAVNLLGIMARLRWGIPMEQFANILTGSEHGAFVPTTTRIRHLLLSPEQTAVYHASFSDFLIEKTAHLEQNTQVRLADYCCAQQATDYGLLNVVYHTLRAGDAGKIRAIAVCQQDWIDDCVTRGADPDTLLSDIEETLAAATQVATAVEIVRMLLIQQRLHFRYNTLFAQHARLAAKALIALGKSNEALQHTTRYGHLIVQPAHVLGLALQLTQTGEKDAALDLLHKADQIVEEALTAPKQKVSAFIDLVHLRIHILAYMAHAGRAEALHEILAFNKSVFAYLKHVFQDAPEEQLDEVLNEIFSDFLGSLMCLQGYYLPLLKLPQFSNKPPVVLLEILVRQLNCYHLCALTNNLPINHQTISKVFDDMATVLEKADKKSLELTTSILDTLILLRAPWPLVNSLAGQGLLSAPPPVNIFNVDKVNVDEEALDEGTSQWRVSSFLQADLKCPAAVAWDKTHWQHSLEGVVKALAWCDGKARRAVVEESTAVIRQTWLDIERLVLQPLRRLTLIQRVEWSDCYAIPEAVLPKIYDQILTLCLDCYREEIGKLLLLIDERFSDQCGMYSEGFRKTLLTVLSRLSQATVDSNDSDLTFTLAERFNEYVKRNLKNRHELVPELLQLIPIFSQLDATELADDIYQTVLSVSMGPGWYKEDQLALMTRTLMRFPAEEVLARHILPSVAANLDNASGEMTFQRYVRFSKAELLGEMCRRGQYGNAVRYFQRQACGTAEELLKEASEGDIDRPSRLRGMRFPGGSLDEQGAISQMLSQTGSSASWQISWALLEIFQHGDSNDQLYWGKAFARLIEQEGGDNDALALMSERMRIIVKADINRDQRQEFLEAFQQHLDTRYRQAFASVLSELGSSNHSNSAKSMLDGNPFISNRLEPNEAELAQESTEDLDDDFSMMPGLFGKSSASSDAADALKKAQAHLTRRNKEQAKEEAIRALKAFQDGDWSIWGDLSEIARGAENLLSQNSSDADSLARSYGPLILAERFAEKWRIADHLMGRIAVLLTAEDRALIAECVLEHVKLMLACEDEKLPAYQFLEESSSASATDSFLELVLWLIDHPQWGRRDKAAELVTWLIDSYPDGMRVFVDQAFSMSNGFRADIICGGLDNLSQLQPLDFWNRIEPLLDLPNIESNCKHVGRIAVLLRIAGRAAGKGADSASSALLTLRATIQGKREAQTHLASDLLPVWADSVKYEWDALATQGLATREVADAMTNKLEQDSSPLDIETAWQLEGLVCEAFGENPRAALNRWNAKLRYALHTSLYSFASENDLEPIERILRAYNPVSLRLVRRLGFTSPSEQWLSCLNGSVSTGFVPASDTHLYLDFHELVMEGDTPCLLEITAFLYPTGRPAWPMSPLRTFSSTEAPNIDDYIAGEVCSSVNFKPAFLGVFTPAMPLLGFMHLSGTSTSDFARSYWRAGRVTAARGAKPMREGCGLSIRRDGLQLPPGWSIGWRVEINGQLVDILRATK